VGVVQESDHGSPPRQVRNQDSQPLEQPQPRQLTLGGGAASGRSASNDRSEIVEEAAAQIRDLVGREVS
jgi:hypothetical protein